MRDDAARLPRADDDYEYLRSRAQAELYAVPSGASVDSARPPQRSGAEPDVARPPRRGRGHDQRRRRPGTAALDLLEVHPPPPRTADPEAPGEDRERRGPLRAPAARYDMRRQTTSRPRAVASPERNRPVAGVEGRGTIEITGQAAQPRRRAVTPSATVAARPDRVALWGVLLGLFLILIAISTAHAG